MSQSHGGDGGDGGGGGGDGGGGGGGGSGGALTQQTHVSGPLPVLLHPPVFVPAEFNLSELTSK